MKKKNNINETQLVIKAGDKVDNLTKDLKQGDSIVVGDGSDNSTNKPQTAMINPTSAVTEDENVDAVIQPQDGATIKYLSNVIDNNSNSNQVSKPFTIDGKKYEMVNGLTPEKQVVLAVFCHDDVDAEGNNLIHPVDHFEKTIAIPMMEKMKMDEKKAEPKQEPKEKEELNLSHYKFFIVNEKTGKFRKLKTLEELAKDTLGKDEKFMGLKQFKKYFENMVFGSAKKTVKKENILEVDDLEEGEDLHAKAKRLMALISKKIPANVFKTIRTNKVAEKEVIEAFAELVGVPIQGLVNLLKTIKGSAVANPNQQQTTQSATGAANGSQMPPENKLAPAGQAENRVITKAQLAESLTKPKTIKTIKVKDLR